MHELVADPAADDPEAALHEAEVREIVARALGALRERERTVVISYFYRGLLLREIAADHGLTEGRISQILRHSLARLREDLAHDPIGDLADGPRLPDAA